MPPKMLRPPPPSAVLAIHSMPNIIRFATSRAVVTGAGPEKTPERLRLIAAMENFRFVPQLWQRVALIPTSEPQLGQICGRGCCLLLPKKRRAEAFQRSKRYCH